MSHTRTYSVADCIVTDGAVYVQDYSYTNVQPVPWRVKKFFGNAVHQFDTFAAASEWMWDRGAIFGKLIIMQDTSEQHEDPPGEFIL